MRRKKNNLRKPIRFLEYFQQIANTVADFGLKTVLYFSRGATDFFFMWLKLPFNRMIQNRTYTATLQLLCVKTH